MNMANDKATNKNSIQVMYNVLAGLAFMLLFGWNATHYFMPPSRILEAVVCIAAAIMFFAGWRKRTLSVVLICMTVVEVVNIVLQCLMFETYIMEYEEGVFRLNVLLMVPDILMAAAYGVAAFMVYKMITQYEIYREKSKLCFLPPLLCGLALIYYTVMYILLEYVIYAWWNISAHRITGYVLGGLGLLFVMLWMRQPMGSRYEEMPRKPTIYKDGYIDMTKHVLLMICTLGIWLLIWVYKTTYYLTGIKCDGGEMRVDPVMGDVSEKSGQALKQLLLCIFIPYYYIYWICSRAKRVEELADNKGIPIKGFFSVCVLFSIIFPILPPILMQDKINEIVIKQNDM